jgi:hypothetical protein
LTLRYNLRRRNRCRFWQILWYRILFSNGFLELLCVCRLYVLPTLFDGRIGDTGLNRRGLRRHCFQRGRRRHNIELVALEALAVVCVRTGCRIHSKFDLLNVLVGLSRDGLNLRTVVVNYGVVRDDIRDVLGLTDDLHVLSRGLDVLRIARRRPVRIADKGVSGWSDLVIRVRP